MEEILHSGVQGMKWYHRYHQSYKTKPTRSGKVGQEHFSKRPSEAIRKGLITNKLKKTVENFKIENIKKKKEEKAKAAFEEEKKRLLENRQKILNSGKAEDVMRLHQQSPLSNEEMKQALDRLRNESDLKKYFTKKKSFADNMDDLANNISKATNLTSKGINAWNTIAQIYNSTNNKDQMPIIKTTSELLNEKKQKRDDEYKKWVYMNNQQSKDRKDAQDRADRLQKERVDRADRLERERVDREDRLEKERADKWVYMNNQRSKDMKDAQDRADRLEKERLEREDRLQKERTDREDRLEKERLEREDKLYNREKNNKPKEKESTRSETQKEKSVNSPMNTYQYLIEQMDQKDYDKMQEDKMWKDRAIKMYEEKKQQFEDYSNKAFHKDTDKDNTALVPYDYRNLRYGKSKEYSLKNDARYNKLTKRQKEWLNKSRDQAIRYYQMEIGFDKKMAEKAADLDMRDELDSIEPTNNSRSGKSKSKKDSVHLFKSEDYKGLNTKDKKIVNEMYDEKYKYFINNGYSKKEAKDMASFITEQQIYYM